MDFFKKEEYVPYSVTPLSWCMLAKEIEGMLCLCEVIEGTLREGIEGTDLTKSPKVVGDLVFSSLTKSEQSSRASIDLEEIKKHPETEGVFLNAFKIAKREVFQNLLHKRDGNRSEWEYPFAVAGINISFMLVQMLDLQAGKPNTIAGVRFLEILSEDEMAFDNLFCVAFEMLDAQWLAKHASYMQFNEVLKFTRVQLERELALDDIYSIKDLPAYNLLLKR